jgi:hypothetical protein
VKKSKVVDADEVWGVAWTYIRTVVDTLREPFLILDENLRVLSANKTFYTIFRDETLKSYPSRLVVFADKVE